MAHPRSHVWSLMVQAGIDSQIAHEALGDLIKHVQRTDANKLRWRVATQKYTDVFRAVAHALVDRIDPDVKTEDDPPSPTPYDCNCYPHGPNEPCTCGGCTSCVGREVGCTCDIDWDCPHKEI